MTSLLLSLGGSRLGRGRASPLLRSISVATSFPQAYDPKVVEKKWQNVWDTHRPEAVQGASLGEGLRSKFYVLAMFPYPSGMLHVGHARVYSISDTIARFHRMKGMQVMHPMGWDAFGLPAENAALERNISPEKWTNSNIQQMKKQLRSLGLHIDWDKEITTCSPEYYRWTQWLFLRLFNAGYAYQKLGKVNWDPIDKTVLANEQVDASGRSWRSGALVEQIQVKQWYFRITAFAQELINDLEGLNWPSKVKQMQRNWIFLDDGLQITFDALDQKGKRFSDLKIFTTRPETLHGATFVAVGPHHPLLSSKKIPEPVASQARSLASSLLEKDEESRLADCATGLHLGLEALNPLTGKKLPVYLASYVSESHSGAIMGVPAHDERDAAFAKHHGIPTVRVLENRGAAQEGVASAPEEVLNGDNGELSGLGAAEARKKVTDLAVAKHVGKVKPKIRLKDWLVSRQRYWGCPIPIVHCEGDCKKPVPLHEEDLPLLLPADVDLKKPADFCKSPLSHNHDWVNTTCPVCQGPAKRETDTMDTFVDSSWYFMRFSDPHNHEKIFSSSRANSWLPVDVYVGGVEHAVLHLLYARFITKFLHSEELLDSCVEPFSTLLVQEMVHGKTFKTKSGRYLKPDELDISGPKPKMKESGEEVEMVYEKMSKSKYNGIDPQHIVDEFGADTTRLFILFKAPPDAVLEWDETSINGPARWLRRLWNLASEHIQVCQKLRANPSGADKVAPLKNQGLSPAEEKLLAAHHFTVKKVTQALSKDYTFNVAIAELMKLSNAITEAKCKESPVYDEAIRALFKMLAPMAPHISSEIFFSFASFPHPAHPAPEEFSGITIPSEFDIFQQDWPTFDERFIAKQTLTITITVDGKKKGTVEVPQEVANDEEQLASFVKKSETCTPLLPPEESVKQVVSVKGRLVNFVTRQSPKAA